VASLIAFAEESGATVSAEGIETRAEGETLRAMGVPCGQGWFLGEPGQLVDVTKTVSFAPDMSWIDGSTSVAPR
jgi:EAL domain-containing protein (putative c-di-GMP-specific phosphodiesterase class I)